MKRKSRLVAKREWKGMWFVAPYLFGILFLFLVPLVQSLWFSFGEIRMNEEMTRYQFEWTGIENYFRALFKELNFANELKNSITGTLMNVPVIVVVSFLIAALIRNYFPGRAFYRVVFFLPVVLSAGVLATLNENDTLQKLIGAGSVVTSSTESALSSMISTDSLSELFLSMNISPTLVNYLTQAVRNIISVVNSSGIQILIFLAALQTISPALVEAAYIEGAGGWEVFWKITLPMVSPQILLVIIYSVIDSFMNTNNPLMVIIQKEAFVRFDVGYAASMTWMYFIIVIAIIGVLYGIISRFVFYENKGR